MTEVIENTDIDLTLLINWEEEMTCEMKCDQEVAWKATNWCGCSFFLCQYHYEFSVSLSDFTALLTCLKCKQETVGRYGDKIKYERV